ncbi:MAG: hypothetical protein Q8J78_04900 [Moraxellaceae bacterium]|nr:hypothetical protein [Moraxellaceae bacterium]
MRRVFVFINGIFNRAGAHDGWTDRAVTWTATRTPHKAEKWEYSAGALTRRFLQQSRAEKVATMLGYYERAGFSIVLVGHSNGSDIIARVLRLRGDQPWFFAQPVRSVHLISPAADEADFEDALIGGDCALLFVYGSANDRALRLGRVSRSLFGWAGLGYGALGLATAPLAEFPNVFVHRNDAYGHSTWLEAGMPFEATMQLLHSRDENPPDVLK